MKIIIYLVGGYIRDKMLGIKLKERDWLVIGCSPSNLLKFNFINIGNFFPVFLHPQTKEEYALARIERKIGKGYKGFKCFNKIYISIDQDLKRRDLTINSIALTHAGNYIDPYNGISDLKKKIIRNVSISFVEDPLRILRTARFLSKFYHLGFKIHASLFFLMDKIQFKQGIKYLSCDRISIEIKKTLLTKNPDVFFKILYFINILDLIIPTLHFIWKTHKNFQKISKIFFNIYTYRQKINNVFFFNNLLKCENISILKKRNVKNTFFYNSFSIITDSVYLYIFFINNNKLRREINIFQFYLLCKIFKQNKFFKQILNFTYIINPSLKIKTYMNSYFIQNYILTSKNYILKIKSSLKKDISIRYQKLFLNAVYYNKLFFYFNYFK